MTESSERRCGRLAIKRVSKDCITCTRGMYERVEMQVKSNIAISDKFKVNASVYKVKFIFFFKKKDK